MFICLKGLQFSVSALVALRKVCAVEKPVDRRMELCHYASQFQYGCLHFAVGGRFNRTLPRRSVLRSCLPFCSENAKWHKELQVAVEVVERACSLCVDVQQSMLTSENGILEKTDQTVATIADFGVQALVSIELSRQFPYIPLVAEEDSGYLCKNNLVGAVANVVNSKINPSGSESTEDEVLKAIDRGVMKPSANGDKKSSYWLLDPIDGTKGFVKGCGALYVVGLALIVKNEIVFGVMGCPNWQENESSSSEFGTIMVAYNGCGTWTRKISHNPDESSNSSHNWTRRFVRDCSSISNAHFCIPESQTWESIPISNLYKNEVVVLSPCCGSLCKYIMVASGKASAFIQRSKSQTSIKAWDHAVGQICVLEAGGKVTDWNGERLDFSADQEQRRVIFPSGGIVVTNGTLHNQILEILNL